jgi:hypothetical protein
MKRRLMMHGYFVEVKVAVKRLQAVSHLTEEEMVC